MSYVFEDAEPVAVTGTGRKAEPNPFTEVIAAIAMQTDEKTGKPVAKRFVQEAMPNDRKTAENRIKRQMSEAGAANKPPVTVRVDVQDLPTTSKAKDAAQRFQVTFWTVRRQERPRTASTPQSVAVTENATE